ncbi:MAG: penicillin-binding protein [Bacteroidales bacterium]|nr:penicillin-binding protein [Bacteroidales bacterium]
MFAEKHYWQDVADKFVQDSIPIRPNRGNIVSEDGQLLAGSLPTYRLYVDFRVHTPKNASPKVVRNDMKRQNRRFELFKERIDSMANGLHEVFPDRSAKWFKIRLEKALSHSMARWKAEKDTVANPNALQYGYVNSVYPREVSHLQYLQVSELPFFNLPNDSTGFTVDEINRRKHPFGSMASQLLGEIVPGARMPRKSYCAPDTARGGLEEAYDWALRGVDGVAHVEKVMNRRLQIPDMPPVDGSDVVTTLNVGMQDVVETALLKQMKEKTAALGIAILMEVETGDVKAIANYIYDKSLRDYIRSYYNNAITDAIEPGSVFKTVSLMIALDDGKITPNTKVALTRLWTEGHGRPISDSHNIASPATVRTILIESSNVGVAKLIEGHYYNFMQQYMDGLKRVGIVEPLNIELPKAQRSWTRDPIADRKNRDLGTLGRLSFGYSSRITPIQTLSFYNAIANNGKMMKPRFVKAISRLGVIQEEIQPAVIKEAIASERTLSQIREMLCGVVTKGTGKAAMSDIVQIAGKTGTAYISEGGYQTVRNATFCGFFPADKPKYSCIVVMKVPEGGGGGVCGPVVKEIAEKIYSNNIFKQDVLMAHDSVNLPAPLVKTGNWPEADKILAEIGQRVDSMGINDTRVIPNQMPDVAGMGARDALCLLEGLGLVVGMNGTGRVVDQSIPIGNPIRRGEKVSLQLHP